MRSSKSTNMLAGQQQQQPKMGGNSAPTSPICRCRVMYLGSSVPHITKDGLQGIQEPLRELYPDQANLDQGNAGIDSWLSVWSNGILIENVDETGREVKRFFKIEALHYCAAVKFVPQLANAKHQTLPSNSNSLAGLPKFLPLDSPHARLQQNNTHPPVFASILRRTTGVKVLECHAFICKREAAANALVRCCFHAYADTMYAKQIGAEIDNIGSPGNESSGQIAATGHLNGSMKLNGVAPTAIARRSKSIANLNDADNETSGEFSDSSNRRLHQNQQQVYSSSMSRRKNPTNGTYEGDSSDISPGQQQQAAIYSNNQVNSNLLKQQNFSKSMHQLNQANPNGRTFDDFPFGSIHSNQSTSYHNLVASNKHQGTESNVSEPFFNPYASRIPSYPPQSIIDQQQSGTLRSVKSVAANSIASTLLRSKKHAKAMSMAQLNQSNAQLNQLNDITSFHQPQHFHHHQQMATIGPGSFMTMPPVPPMFLPNIQRLPQVNGSQTMKLPGRHQQHQMLDPLPQINFEAMTPKEMKKLLKKSAKYGIDPSRFTENGLPMLPLQPMPMPLHMPPAPPAMQMQPPPPLPSNKSGTLSSQSLYSMDLHQPDVPDYNSQTLAYSTAGLGLPPPPPDGYQGPMQPIKSILVKPNPEFLKSKAGKKWLKQQKEFKKLLPPHLDGLPIVFGPPPLDALEPAEPPASNGGTMQAPTPPQFLHHHQQPPPPPALPPTSLGLPVMDANGYYNPHPFYGPSGRASAASTLLRYSPHLQMMQQQYIHENAFINGANRDQQIDFIQRNRSQPMYSDPSSLINQQKSSMLMKNGTTESVYSSQLGAYERQFPFGSERAPTGHSHLGGQTRNRMVEQSVISLGDENDDDDDGDDNGHDQQAADEDDDGGTEGYYDRVGSTSSQPANNQLRRSRQHEQQQLVNYSENDDHQHRDSRGQQQASDDHSSYSSSAGIYRRKHINERAFSYSIRQEHRSNGTGNTSNSDADYGPDDTGGDFSDSQQQQQQHYHQVRKVHDANNNKHFLTTQQQQQQQHRQRQQQQRTYDCPQNMQAASIHQNKSQLQYARNSLQQNHHQPPPPPPPVDMDLSARLEQQLGMKSFTNSGVKSHM